MIYDQGSEADGDKKNDRKKERGKRGTAREAQMVADRGDTLHTHTHTHTQMRWVSNQTEAGRTAVGENEFCSLEARRERKKREERKEKRKEGRSE